MAAMVNDRTTIYTGTVLQGAVIVIFSAYTAIFVNRHHYDLTLAQYGALFIPQLIAAVLAALFAANICCWIRAQRVYRAGLSCSLAGMACLIATEWAERLPLSYPLLLAATALVGAGAGLTFSFLRCYAVSLNPLHARRQILLMNGLLAAGMAAAPAYALLTRTTIAWWSLPLVLGVLLIAEIMLTGSLRTPPDGAPARLLNRPVPGRFRAYPGLALLYGICAVVCLTAPHYLTGRVPSSHHLHLLELAEVGFWAALVVGGRVVFGIIDGMKSRQHLANIGVFMVGIILLALSVAMTRYALMHIGIYVLAAFGCAALLPIDTRPGNEHMAAFPLAVAVGLMVVFPVGLGLSRFAYDDVQRGGLSPFEAFISVAVVGATACILLLPTILAWHTLGYFELPLGGNSRLAALRQSGAGDSPDALAAGLPSHPRTPPDDASRVPEARGAGPLRRGLHGKSRPPGRPRR